MSEYEAEAQLGRDHTSERVFGHNVRAASVKLDDDLSCVCVGGGGLAPSIHEECNTLPPAPAPNTHTDIHTNTHTRTHTL